MDYGIKIKQQGINKNVQDCVPKELAFYSATPCAKILQIGKKAGGNASEVTLDPVLSFPLDIFVFLFNSTDSYYYPIDAEFNTTTLFLPTSDSANDYYYYFITYA